MASRRSPLGSETGSDLERILRSLEETVGSSGGDTGSVKKDTMSEPALADKADQALAQLSPGQQALIRTLYGFDALEPQTPERVSAVTGVRQERLEEAEVEALRQLRRPVNGLRIVKH